MGGPEGIANPLTRKPKKPESASTSPFAEQRIGGGAVGSGLVTVGFDPQDFRFEQRDAFGQLVLRKRAKILAREGGGAVTFGPGEIIQMHHGIWSPQSGMDVNIAAQAERAIKKFGKAIFSDCFLLASDGAAAHARMEAGEHIGKIVLEVAGD
jgi:hypothetical protein